MSQTIKVKPYEELNQALWNHHDVEFSRALRNLFLPVSVKATWFYITQAEYVCVWILQDGQK